MASSGLASFTMTRDGMILSALRLLRVLQEDQTLSAYDIYSGNEAINILLKNWQVLGMVVSLYQQIAVPMVANQNSYTIGPVGADVIIERPIQLYDGSFYRRTVAGVVTDTALELLSRQGYEQIVAKLEQGSPTYIYYEPTIDIAPALPLYPTSPSIGWGTLHVYFNPINSSDVVYINVRRAVQDMISGGDEFDLPQEWFLPLRWGLAAELADEYEVPEDRCKRIFDRAELYRQRLVDWQKALYDTNFADRRAQVERVMDNEKPT